MESSEHNWANISETICPKMLKQNWDLRAGALANLWQVGVLDVVLSEYLDKSHNLTNLIFMTSSL